MACTFAFAAIDGFAPVDMIVRVGQARLFPKPASGTIIFVGLPPIEAVQSAKTQHLQLARLVDGLEAGGAAGIYLDLQLQPVAGASDAALRHSLRNAPHTWIVDRVTPKQGSMAVVRSDARFRTPNARPVDYTLMDPFGFVWNYPAATKQGIAHAVHLPSQLAGQPTDGRDFTVDYSYAFDTIPKLAFADAFALSDRSPRAFAGKRVVVGLEAMPWQPLFAIPGHQTVAPSILPIYAAETLLGGAPGQVSWLLAIAGMTLVLALATRCTSAWGRRALYAGAVGAVVLAFLSPPLANVFVELGAATGLVAIYAMLRGWSNLRDRGRLISDVTGLPTFRVLETDLQHLRPDDRGALVIARIHRFDEVLATLPTKRHRDFVQAVASRFRATDEGLVIHSNDGRYLAWVQGCETPVDLEAHLLGLRALFAMPLNLDGVDIDVGVTFAADFSDGDAPAQRLANAMAAVDGTSEAEQPVRIAAPASQEDRLWHLSLQSKIDRALHSGEIFVLYQPQYHLATGAFTGCEALVRWNDRERGFIAPSFFIEQCELAGRMESLTRKVLGEAAAAFLPLARTVPGIRLSVNMSATLLASARTVDLVLDTLRDSGLPPDRLTIEITETARIADFEMAHAIMQRLRDVGVGMSIDDFGVGSANFQTLWRLPFDEIKIDRMFVARMLDDPKARAIVEASVAMARDCGVAMVAEGIETDTVKQALIRLDCAIGQGFGLALPGVMPDAAALSLGQGERKSA